MRLEWTCWAQELRESLGGRPRLPAPNSPYGLCGRKATWKKSVRSLWTKSNMGKVRTVSVDEKQHGKVRTVSVDEKQHGKVRTVSVDEKQHGKVRTVSVDEKQHGKSPYGHCGRKATRKSPYGLCGRKATSNCLRAQELCDGRGGRPGFPSPCLIVRNLVSVGRITTLEEVLLLQASLDTS